LGIYVEQREQLKGLVLMVDIRRGLTDLDLEMVNWFTPLAKPIHVLLTKSDKLTKSLCNQTLFAVRKTLTEIAGPWATVQLFSSTNRVGLEEAGERIGGWILEHKIDSTPEDA
jgi:GTP-binding protein